MHPSESFALSKSSIEGHLGDMMARHTRLGRLDWIGQAGTTQCVVMAAGTPVSSLVAKFMWAAKQSRTLVKGPALNFVHQ